VWDDLKDLQTFESGSDYTVDKGGRRIQKEYTAVTFPFQEVEKTKDGEVQVRTKGVNELPDGQKLPFSIADTETFNWYMSHPSRRMMTSALFDQEAAKMGLQGVEKNSPEGEIIMRKIAYGQLSKISPKKFLPKE